jgi:DoxX-like family
MTITLIIFGSLLAFAAIGSAISKLVKVPDVMAAMESVGVKANQVPVLAFLEIAGGLGIIAGIWAPGLGTLASICLVAYFAGALLSHMKKKHKVADFGAALGIFITAIVTTYLQLQR